MLKTRKLHHKNPSKFAMWLITLMHKLPWKYRLKCKFCGGHSPTMHLYVEPEMVTKDMTRVTTADLPLDEIICDSCYKAGMHKA